MEHAPPNCDTEDTIDQHSRSRSRNSKFRSQTFMAKMVTEGDTVRKSPIQSSHLVSNDSSNRFLDRVLSTSMQTNKRTTTLDNHQDLSLF